MQVTNEVYETDWESSKRSLWSACIIDSWGSLIPLSQPTSDSIPFQVPVESSFLSTDQLFSLICSNVNIGASLYMKFNACGTCLRLIVGCYLSPSGLDKRMEFFYLQRRWQKSLNTWMECYHGRGSRYLGIKPVTPLLAVFALISLCLCLCLCALIENLE